jgi:hypothetical protein
MGWNEDTRRLFVQTYSLDAPLDEEYAARHLATCFQTWHQFLAGRRPVVSDPSGVLGTALQRPSAVDVVPVTTPEARFSLPQPLGAKLLGAFVDADFPETRVDAGWLATYLAVERVVAFRGGAVRRVRRRIGVADVRSAASDFAMNYLRGLGCAQ